MSSINGVPDSHQLKVNGDFLLNLSPQHKIADTHCEVCV